MPTISNLIADFLAAEAKAQTGIAEMHTAAQTMIEQYLTPVNPSPIEPPPAVELPGDIVYSGTVYLNGDMSPLEIASKVSVAPAATKFVCRGDLGTIRIGGRDGDYPGKMNEVCFRENLSPLRGMTFIAEDGFTGKLSGLHLHNSHGGFDKVVFDGFHITPAQDGARAAVHCEENFDDEMLKGGQLGLLNCGIYAPDHWTSYYGYGYKQGIIMRESCLFARNVNFLSPPKEHPFYLHNMMGSSHIRKVDVMTKTLKILGTDILVETGPGRTLAQVQERRTDGEESYGDITFEDMRVSLCCAESVVAGKKASGGSALTVGGHRGTVRYKDIHIDRPMTNGVVAVWRERESDGTPKGFRDPSVDRIEMENISWVPYLGEYAANRTAIKISSAGSVWADMVGHGGSFIADPWNSAFVRLNADALPGDHFLTPDDVQWG